MKRKSEQYNIAEGQYATLRGKMLNWSKQYDIFLFLDSNEFEDKYGRYECLLAVGSVHDIAGNEGDMLAALQATHDKDKDWLFGHITYNYKNNLEPKLSSAKPAKTGWDALHFFCPAIVCHINRQKDTLTIESVTEEPEDVYRKIRYSDADLNISVKEISFTPRTDKETYLENVGRLRTHIKEGDCYEVNYCCEGYSEGQWIKPLDVYRALNTLSPAPFSAFYRNHNKYLICASIERYLQKQGDAVVSQPIKGTARRDINRELDKQVKENLANSIKDRAENLMIVDLVRNDLARCSEPGSVNVDELCKIYTFSQVHQMISTISAKMKHETAFTDAIRYSFPMGSMTGAPKIKVMELIERYEDANRELYSGTVGYIDPSGNFDFNVIIRSIFYNASTDYLSYQTGGAITYDSDPEMEWEEMRLKAWALEKVFK